MLRVGGGGEDRAGEMTSEVGRGPGLPGPKVTPPKTEKSLDLTHYFSKRAQYNKIKVKCSKKYFWTSKGPKPSRAEGESPPKPE